MLDMSVLCTEMCEWLDWFTDYSYFTAGMSTISINNVCLVMINHFIFLNKDWVLLLGRH